MIDVLVLGGWSLLASLATMVVVWVVAVRIRDNSIADVAWGGVFIVQAALCLAIGPAHEARTWLVAAMVAAWGLRLGTYIATRAIKRGHEDKRYAQLRERWGDAWKRKSLTNVFLLQGLFAGLIGLAAPLTAANEGGALGARDWVGLGVFVVGLVTEAVADQQVTAFQKRRTGPDDFLHDGLYRYSRHPNYFGEALLWTGIAITATGAPWGWIAFGSAAIISYLVRFGSGVPMLEARWRDTPGYAEYARRTNVFIPAPPLK